MGPYERGEALFYASMTFAVVLWFRDQKYYRTLGILESGVFCLRGDRPELREQVLNYFRARREDG